MYKLAKDLQPGDRVVDADGKVLTVRAIGNGMTHNPVLIDWNEGRDWSCVPRCSEFKIAN